MARCPGCYGEATVRINGRVREHRMFCGWACAGSGRLPLLEREPEAPAGPPAPAPRVTEEQLFQGYSGLVALRPGPIPTPETVRAHLAAASDEDPAPRPVNREEVAR
jgi:hypothetical protein